MLEDLASLKKPIIVQESRDDSAWSFGEKEAEGKVSYLEMRSVEVFFPDDRRRMVYVHLTADSQPYQMILLHFGCQSRGDV